MVPDGGKFGEWRRGSAGVGPSGSGDLTGRSRRSGQGREGYGGTRNGSGGKRPVGGRNGGGKRMMIARAVVEAPAGHGANGRMVAEDGFPEGQVNGGALADWEMRDQEWTSGRAKGGAEATLTSRLQGVAPLSAVYPSEFLELVCLYEDALCSAAEARLYKTGYQVSETLLELSLRLGRLEANARDVIELHACGVRAVTNDMNAFKACVYMEEARLMTLELMGNLANFYRHYCVDFTGKSSQE